MARIEYTIGRIGALRVSMDSLGAIFNQFSDTANIRQELFRIAVALKSLHVTAVLTSERTQEYGEIARFGIEEFVADNVIILRNILEDEKRRRTIEILKYRGTSHHKGEYPFTIQSETGIILLPLSAIELKQKSSNIRITSGSEDLDRMCSGGFFRDSIILVSGATGTGKTFRINFLYQTKRDRRIIHFSHNLSSWRGKHNGRPFRDVTGIISGHPHQISAGEIDRLDSLFNHRL